MGSEVEAVVVGRGGGVRLRRWREPRSKMVRKELSVKVAFSTPPVVPTEGVPQASFTIFEFRFAPTLEHHTLVIFSSILEK